MSVRLEVVRGTDKQVQVDLVDTAGSPIPLETLAGAAAEFVVRESAEAPDLIHASTSDAGSSIAFLPDRPAIALAILAAMTEPLAIKEYLYRVRVALANAGPVDAIEWSPFDVVQGGSATPQPPPFDSVVAIDQDFGLPRDLAYVTPGGSPIEGAQVRVYSASDYAARKLDAPVGVTTTDSFGGWRDPIFVKPGFSYVVRLEKPNEWGPNTREITV